MIIRRNQQGWLLIIIFNLIVVNQWVVHSPLQGTV